LKEKALRRKFLTHLRGERKYEDEAFLRRKEGAVRKEDPSFEEKEVIRQKEHWAGSQ